MLKNVFDLIALKGDGDRKTSGMSTCIQVWGLMLVPTASVRVGETFTT